MLNEKPSTRMNFNESFNESLNLRQRKQLQHEIKNYVTQYFKKRVSKAADSCKVILYNDVLIIRSENFLTEPEKQIITLQDGSELVRASRMQVAKQHAIDNLSYFEEKLGAKCIHQVYDVDATKDLWVQIMFFDKVLTED